MVSIAVGFLCLDLTFNWAVGLPARLQIVFSNSFLYVGLKLIDFEGLIIRNVVHPIICLNVQVLSLKTISSEEITYNAYILIEG